MNRWQPPLVNSSRWSRRTLAAAVLLVQAVAGHTQTNFGLVGYTELEAYLGSGNVPDGSSVSVSQIEAPNVNGRYRIDPTNSQFAGKTITFSPTFDSLTTLVSGHANNVGTYMFGLTGSMTPGITDIYEMAMTGSLSDGFLGSDFLRTSQNFLAPLVETRDLQNHSWVAGSTGVSATDLAIINRMDFAVARDNFVAVVGVNNAPSVAAGASTADPNLNVNLLSSAYNVISVGRANGSHAYGDTVIPVAGRQRPHIVVDSSLTSWGTAIASSASALMLDGAMVLFEGDVQTIADAQDFRTVKSLLMAGAVKDGLGPTGTHVWTAESSSSPLDEIYGAGRLNVLNSYQILEAGPQAASAVSDVERTGWNFGSLDDSADDTYFFDLTGADLFALSISLNWAIELAPVGGNYNAMVSTLADLTLSVFEAEGFTLQGGPIAVSESSTENLEYLWLADLAPGRYALRVSSDDVFETSYGLAWQSLVVPEPSALMLVLGAAFLGFFRRPSRLSVEPQFAR